MIAAFRAGYESRIHQGVESEVFSVVHTIF